jgi:hypothetical protein
MSQPIAGATTDMAVIGGAGVSLIVEGFAIQMITSSR